jgi:hypothetical protein
MAESSFGGQEDTQVCEQCKQEVDASAPLRPLELAELRQLFDKRLSQDAPWRTASSTNPFGSDRAGQLRWGLERATLGTRDG